jgi:hypothetical protein
MNQQPLLKKLKIPALITVIAITAFVSVRAADVFFFESFEIYNLGPLDANLFPSMGGVNNYPDGGAFSKGSFFNPWWGSQPPNLIVVGSENGVTPHSGSKMARGGSTNGVMTVSQDIYNIAYRENRGAPFRGGIVLDWWFYDPIGTTPTSINYQDSLSLVYYSSLPTNADYSDAFFGTGGTPQFAIGASTDQNGAFDPTKYQVQLTTANGYDGSGPGLGWFNTSVGRTIGWHHARITVSAALPTGSAFVFFYIDDLAHAAFSSSTPVGTGVNAIEMDAGYGDATGYYDDISFDLGQHAQLTMTKSKTNVVLRWPAGWVLQNSTNAVSANFSDVSGATSPYTNNYSGITHLYRLRSANP